MHRWPASIALASLLCLTACPPEQPVRTAEDFGPPTQGDTKEDMGLASDKPAAPAKEDAPEVSRSTGPKGGVLVFWPRVWPRDDADPRTRELSVQVQKKMEALARRAAGTRTIEARPEPERVCPSEGCQATTVGAVLVLRDKACAVVAVVAGPGTSPSRLLPWAGKAKFGQESVPFREPPEEQVKVEDYVACDKLLDGTENQDAAIAKYIAGLLPGG
jgi:hypothetical protein